MNRFRQIARLLALAGLAIAHGALASPAQVTPVAPAYSFPDDPVRAAVEQFC